MNRLFFPPGILLLVCASWSASPAQEGAKPLQEAMREEFAWLDAFDAFDTSGLPYVRVFLPGTDPFGDGAAPGRMKPAFLLAHGDGRFAVRFADLMERTYQATPPGSPEEDHVGWEPGDLASDVLRFAADLGRNRDAGWQPYLSNETPERTMSLAAQAVLLARACHARGLGSEAELLFAAALRERKASLADDIETASWWQIQAAFSDPAIPRRRILELIDRHLRAFPGRDPRYQGLDRVEDLREDVVRSLAEEDERRSRADPTHGSTEEIEALILELRDQSVPDNDVDSAGLGDPWLVAAPSPSNRASEQLKALGFASVPRLIEAYGDRHLSRCVRYGPRFGGSFQVTPVRWLVNDILEAIACRSFYAGQADVEAWWQVASQEGEVAWLQRVIRTDEGFTVQAATRLARLDRAAAIAALRQRLEGESDPWRRARVAGALADLGRPEAADALERELEVGPSLACRVEAARGLLILGREDTLPPMIRAFETVAAGDAGDSRRWDALALAQLLAGSGRAEGALALGAGCARGSADVIDAVLEAVENVLDPPEPWWSGRRTRWPVSPEPAAWSFALERILLERRGDPRDPGGEPGPSGPRGFRERAARLLARLSPLRYRHPGPRREW